MPAIYDADGLTIRSYQPSDADVLVRIADNPNIARNLTNLFPHPYTRADADTWIALTTNDPGAADNWALIWKGELVGGIGLRRKADVYERTLEIGYWLGEAFWGQGIATRAVRAVTKHAFADPRLLRVEAGVFSYNPASARVLEKAGYTLEGRHRNAVCKNDVVADRLMYARVRDD